MRKPLLAQHPRHQRERAVAGEEARDQDHRRRRAGRRGAAYGERRPCRRRSRRPRANRPASPHDAALAQHGRRRAGLGTRRAVRKGASGLGAPAEPDEPDEMAVTLLRLPRGNRVIPRMLGWMPWWPSPMTDSTTRRPRWPSRSEELFAPVGRGVELCYQTFGDPDDDPLLLVMGLGGPMTWWDPELCRMLAGRGFYVIRYDNRDTGRSTKVAGTGHPRDAGPGVRRPPGASAVRARRPGRRRLRPARPPRARVGPRRAGCRWAG